MCNNISQNSHVHVGRRHTYVLWMTSGFFLLFYLLQLNNHLEGRWLKNEISAIFLQEALRELWSLSFPERNLTGLVSEQWKDMGWQGNDPSTDFRLPMRSI